MKVNQRDMTYRAKEVVSDVRGKIDLAVILGQREDKFDSEGRYRFSKSDRYPQALATFDSSWSSDVKVDPKTNEVQSFRRHFQAGRRSLMFGDDFVADRDTMKKTPSGEVYTRSVRKFSEDECESYTEKVRVSSDGSQQYTRTDHLEGKLERFFRKNPSVRLLGAQLMGGALGASIGVLVGMHLGLPPALAVGSGSCIGATLGATIAREIPSSGERGLLEKVAMFPSAALYAVAGMGTAASALAMLVMA